MERIEDEIFRIISNGGKVSDEESELIFCYIKNLTIIVLDVIKNDGKPELMSTDEGQSFFFRINDVYDALGIKCKSEYYNYNIFKDYILSVVTQVLAKAGYVISITDHINSTSKEQSNDFTLNVYRDIKYIKLNEDINNRDVTLELGDNSVEVIEDNNELNEVETRDYNKEENYSNSAVVESTDAIVGVNVEISNEAQEIEDEESVETVKHIKWSNDFIQRMIYEWQHYFAVFLRGRT